MNERPKITVVGSFMTDLMSRTPHLPVPGETVMGGPFKLGPGGKGANQAVAAARLGAEVTMVVSLGEDSFGDLALANLEAEGIETRYVKRVAATHTGAALIMVDDVRGDNMIVVAPGSNGLLGPEDVEAARTAISASDCVVLQLEIPLETVAYTVRLAGEAGVPVILNPAPGRAIPPEVLAGVRTVTPNETEAQIITGLAVDSPEAARAAGEWLVTQGAREAVITLGGQGALAVSADGAFHVPGYPVSVVDTTGAGDAFNGALAVALAERESLPAAVRFANAAAALSVTRLGTAPAMPTRTEVDEFLEGQR